MTAALRLGLIGCGGIIMRSHLPALLQLGQYGQVCALADPVAANRNAVGANANVPAARRHDDYRNLLAAGELDFVIIATPPEVPSRKP